MCLRSSDVLSQSGPLDHCDPNITICAHRDQSQLPDVVLRGDQSFGAADQVSCRVCGVSFSLLLTHVCT